MPDDEPRDPPPAPSIDPRPLDYRSGAQDRDSTAARATGAGVLAFITLWAGAFAGGAVASRRGIIVGGLAAAAIVMVITQLLRRNERNHAYVAGAWVGLAIGLLLVGWCAAVL
jgi:hypothetical protein